MSFSRKVTLKPTHSTVVKGKLQPNQNLAYFVRYLKSISTFSNDIIILKQMSEKPRPSGSCVIDQNMQNKINNSVNSVMLFLSFLDNLLQHVQNANTIFQNVLCFGLGTLLLPVICK